MQRSKRKKILDVCWLISALSVAVYFGVVGGVYVCQIIPSTTPEPTTTTHHMRVTAYCPCIKCCGQWADGMTASGKPVTANGGRFVAADKSLSFGTLVVVPGYADGEAVPVLDRGGAIRGDRLDVFFPTHDEALEWGVRWLDVQIGK